MQEPLSLFVDSAADKSTQAPRSRFPQSTTGLKTLRPCRWYKWMALFPLHLRFSQNQGTKWGKNLPPRIFFFLASRCMGPVPQHGPTWRYGAPFQTGRHLSILATLIYTDQVHFQDPPRRVDFIAHTRRFQAGAMLSQPSLARPSPPLPATSHRTVLGSQLPVSPGSLAEMQGRLAKFRSLVYFWAGL